MAELVACIAMSHAPQLMLDPDHWTVLHTRSWDPLPENPALQNETPEVKWRKWEQCMAAINQLRLRLEQASPDVILVVGDDQHENLIDDNMPPFSIFIGDEVEASTSLKQLKQPLSANRTRYAVDAHLATWLTDELMECGFDPAYSRRTRYEGGLGHAFARPLKFLAPEPQYPIVPIMINTYYPPVPSAKRCVQFGLALGDLVRRYPERRRVVILASGGLSHTKVDEDLDAGVIKAMQGNDLELLSQLPSSALMEGTSEIRNWVVTAAAANKPMQLEGYTPLYRTTTGVGVGMGFAHW